MRKGAFNRGDASSVQGRFELAEGGTIFLDEVGELPAETQIALLRVSAGNMNSSVSVELHPFGLMFGWIAATNRDLAGGQSAGRRIPE